jgi:Ca-activated chloride channel family protein
MMLRAGLALAVACSGLFAQAQSPFSAKVEVVRVDVLVTDNGQPVRGLTPGDFDVLDEGVAQQVDLISFEQIPLNAILALDMSASVAGERLEHLRNAGRAVLDQLKPEDQGALVTFSHALGLGSDLTHDVSRVRAALDAADASGDTALVDATYGGIMLAESDVGRALLLVFSDGVDTSSWLSPEAVLNTAKRSDVVVYGVAVRGGATPRFLRDLSAFTGGSLFEIDSTNNLNALFVRILEEFRHRYLVSYTPRGVSHTGWHRLEVRVKGRKATVKARPGYFAGS